MEYKAYCCLSLTEAHLGTVKATGLGAQVGKLSPREQRCSPNLQPSWGPNPGTLIPSVMTSAWGLVPPPRRAHSTAREAEACQPPSITGCEGRASPWSPGFRRHQLLLQASPSHFPLFTCKVET